MAKKSYFADNDDALIDRSSLQNLCILCELEPNFFSYYFGEFHA